MIGLTNQEIMKIVNRYIGVSGGYLGDFTYRTHTEFYPEYCDLDIDPNNFQGTTRERFIEILRNASPDIQSKIVRGVLDRFSIGAENKPQTRNQELFNELIEVADRLENISLISAPTLKTTKIVVEHAINDIETLIKSNNAISGVDRIHTALHGYLQALCDRDEIQYRRDDNMARLLKLLRQNHPSLKNVGPQSQDIERILNSFSNILDALNPIRNNASIAHPNEYLIEKDEAILIINVARTLLFYLEAKFGQSD